MSYSAQISFSGSLVSMNDRPKVDQALNEVFGKDNFSSADIEKIIESSLETKSIINLQAELDVLRKINNVNFDTMSELMLEELVFTIERLFLIKINIVEYIDNTSELMLAELMTEKMLAELMTEKQVIENRYARQNMKLKIIIVFQSLVMAGFLMYSFVYIASHQTPASLDNGKWTVPNTVDSPLNNLQPSKLPTPPNGIKGPADVNLNEIKPVPPKAETMPVNPVTEIKP